jgi:5-methylthioadenosine/S-adenosylhomocysteine deaminase
MIKKAADLLVEAAWVIPANGAPNIADGAVAIGAGRILALGRAEDLNAAFSPDSRVTLPDHMLAPGLISSHGHLAMNLLRGCAEDLPLQNWLQQRIWPLEANHVSAQFVRDGTALALLEMLRAGITCCSDMYFYPEIAAEEVLQAGMRAQLAFPVLDFANSWSRDADDAIHKGLALADRYRHEERLQIAFGPHSIATVSDAVFARILMFSEELDLKVQIHLHENAEDVADNRQQLGRSGIAHLHQLDLLGPNLQAVHVTQLEDEELALLAATNAQVIHCPTSNAKLASGTCPVTRLLDAGINVALGTDSAASNNRLSILGEARQATLLAKLADSDATALPAATALDMATINGASALGWGAQLGSLEVDKCADLIAINIRAPELQPLYDPHAALIHSGADQQVSHVWVGGECLLEGGQATRVDEAAILERAFAWQRRIQP